MIGVIIGSRKMGINPDNVATPIAASLGDLITLALLSGISWGLYKELGEEQQKASVSPWSLRGLLCLPLISASLSAPSVLGVCRIPALELPQLGLAQVREGLDLLTALHTSSSPGGVLRERLSPSRCQAGAGAVGEGSLGFPLWCCQLQLGILRAGLQLETPNFLLLLPLLLPSPAARMQGCDSARFIQG